MKPEMKINAFLLTALAVAFLENKAPADITSGLIAHWTFDETNGLVAADSSGKGNQASLFNFPSDNSQWVPGRMGGAVYFNSDTAAHDDYVLTDAPIKFDNQDAFSFSFWFKRSPGATGPFPRVITPLDQYHWILWGQGRGVGFYPPQLSERPYVGVWQHYVVVYDRVASTYSVFLDGSRVLTDIAGTSRSTPGAARWILGHNESVTQHGDHWFGALDDVRIYNRLLTPADVNELFESTPPVSSPMGQVRFQVLTPTLVRMEYSPTANFIDAPSVSVLKRDWPEAPFTREEKDGWLSLSTEKMTVRYKMGSGRFTAKNLQITWRDGGEHRWKPGDKDDQNLGGVPGDMAGQVAPVTAPGPLTRNGYFLLDDSQTALRDAAAHWVQPRPENGGQDWYFFVYGHDYAHLLSEFSQLLGPIPMVPRYVFGAWFGSRAAYSDQQWKMILDQFREESLPLDVMVLDSFSTTKMIWSGYDWDLEQMPDPKEFFHWMRERGVKITVNEHYAPLTPESDSNFDTIRKEMGLPPETKAIGHDLASQKYAQLFMDLLHKPALDMGMAFWWQDGCAPANMEGLDPMLWTREVEYLGSEQLTGKRAFIFCRLGAWGSHRYGAYFSGDLNGVWDCLNVMVPATQQAGNMLVAYINNLCAGVGTVDLPVELYQRWVQFGAFSPIIWFHGVWGLRLPWEYGPEGIETYRKFVGLRYALIPYTYTYSKVAHETGLPLVRGMYLEYPNQEPAYTHRQQFMFGKELLVAPVTEAAFAQPALKQVLLPTGDDWFDYFTGDIYGGGQTITHECPVDRMPLFVRAGSILPMAPPMDYSDQKPVDPLTLDVYAGKPAQFRLYEDDGISLDYRQGESTWTLITFRPASGQGNHTLTIGPAEGNFKGQLQNRKYVGRLHGLLKPKAVLLNGQALAELGEDACGEGWRWDAKSRVTTVRLTHALPVREAAALLIEGAGTFADAQVLQQALNLRSQVRQVKRELKLKQVSLTGAADIKKPPRVIRETEKVEEQLNQLAANPIGVGQNPPDFAALRKRVLLALEDRPFESNRSIPEADPLAQATTEKIKDGKFTAAEIQKLTGILLGAEVPARGLSRGRSAISKP